MKNLIRIYKAIIVIGIFTVIASSISFIYHHLKALPDNVSFYPEEITLFLCMLLFRALAIVFGMEKSSKIAFIGIIISMLNLFMFQLVELAS
ncbi:hypothetical protein KQI42_10035 [Tissierella sp. MSJ-40]|uniref:Uncharacterized protein n=1 Tax=Tissierella simiarum TaxID=2841534 RepID=A0ABS6E5Z2_9FIRM|nr:hypothetical protein [Tissierella simiarum]MBU5438350.1 hypothetical protein [Tissierella simiarum]